MTRVFLAAGVAALAISAPASAKPDREHGGQAAQTQKAERPQRAQRAERQQPTQRVERQAQRVERPQRQERMARAERPQRVEREQRVARAEQRPQRVERQERVARADKPQRVERQQQRVERMERQQVHGQRVEQAQNLRADRHDLRAQRVEQAQNRALDRRALREERIDNRLANNGVGYGVGGCPPGLNDKGCVPPGQALKAARIANAEAFRASRFATTLVSPRIRVVDPLRATRVVGLPLRTAGTIVPLMAVPQTVSYLYPDTDDYYWRYSNGYMYQVDRDTSLIASLLPLLAGGYMPGSYLPNYYMNSYAPNYYGLNSFYPATAYNYGYGGYNQLCNRYVNGIVYQVDCATGLIADVMPIYAGGYGVGQMLPSSYGYYNVPYQYRSMYYDTPDYNYWYAPGAIYQVDPATSLITSVAALLTPGFTVGQPLPMGYNMYNVPMAYRSTYYDTPNAWYRYNNGYIYQVDPTTQLVTAIVASILT